MDPKKTMPENPNSVNMGNLDSQVTVAPPRFLIIKKKDGTNFDKVNPFFISKSLYSLIGECNIKKIKEGLLVECRSSKQSQKLLSISVFCDFEVEIVPHRTLNYSKGIIFCWDLLEVSEEEILEELKDQNICEVRRIKTKRDGELRGTPSLILTFNTPVLPKKIKVAFYNLEVREFIPNPTRCYRCQRFGHSAARCSSVPVCICGKPLHEGSPCGTPKCINCDEEHLANSKNCPKYKEEFAIKKISIQEKISYNEARRKLAPTPKATVSYAKAAALTKPQQPDVKELAAALLPILISSIRELINTQQKTLPETTTLVEVLPGASAEATESTPRREIDATGSDAHASFKTPTAVGTEKRKRGGHLERPRSISEESSETDPGTKSSWVKKKGTGWEKGRLRQKPPENK